MERGPLTGVRVLDWTQQLPGPYAAWNLAALGAEVVKVEPPRGDAARRVGALFDVVNGGKQSVALDLRDPADQARFRGLVGAVDVVIEGFRPGVAARLGCDPAWAVATHPRLIWCAISAFGQVGPAAATPGHDLNAQALAGLPWLERSAGGAPRPSVLPVADFGAAATAVSAILAALVARERTGRGALLDVAMSDTVAHWAQVWGQGADLATPAEAALRRWIGRSAARRWLAPLARTRLYALPAYGVFRCADGAWLAVGIVDEPHFWRALCRALGLRGLGRLGLGAQLLTGRLVRPVVAARLATRGRAHWLAVLEAADVPVSPVLSLDEVRAHPQLGPRGWTATGALRPPIPGASAPQGPGPALGAHDAPWIAAALAATEAAPMAGAQGAKVQQPSPATKPRSGAARP
jgi:crotonobetainyl-CoA:carnitine CoA-transferase CaiB-like acyl-CoA transferase